MRDPDDQNAAGSEQQIFGADESNHGRASLNGLHGRAPAIRERSWHWAGWWIKATTRMIV